VAEGFEPVRGRIRRRGGGRRRSPCRPAQVAAYRHGEQVVDLWTGLEITGDSLLGAYSTSKGAAYLVVALLVQEGALDLDEKVSHYWPEFAAGGKRDILLRELLAHRAGFTSACPRTRNPERTAGAHDPRAAARAGGERYRAGQPDRHRVQPEPPRQPGGVAAAEPPRGPRRRDAVVGRRGLSVRPGPHLCGPR
jgi:CubicO group peptidase (beta-lactamase class C family)